MGNLNKLRPRAPHAGKLKVAGARCDKTRAGGAARVQGEVFDSSKSTRPEQPRCGNSGMNWGV